MKPATTTMTASPRRRLLALVALLALSLGLSAVLAVQAIQTVRRHRATAEHALQDYADFAAFILASRAYRQLGGDVAESFAQWPAWGAAAPAAARLPAGTVCAGGPTLLQQVPMGGELAARGAPLDTAERAWLRDTLRNAGPLLQEVGWRFRFVRAPPGPVAGWFFASWQIGPNAWGLRLIAACLDGADSPFRQVMRAERVLPPSVTGNLPADSLYAITVAGGGRVVYASPVTYTSPYRGTARLGAEFGDLEVALVLRRDIAGRLVSGGLPPSPVPLAAGLLALATLLVIGALLQLRREYQLIRVRSDFVSSVSHELRTPLSQILIFTDLLKLGRLRTDAERERAVDVVDQETRRLIRLVENVLTFARSEGPRRRMDHEAVALAGVVHETLEAFRPLAAARDVSLRADVPAGTAVQGDRHALRQVLLNLLDNAVKYGPRGQTIEIRSSTGTGRTLLAVEDQGPGIPLAERERVWEGFVRLARDQSSGVAGSGIGLAVVRALARDMGGDAWIEDAPTGGARFVLALETAGPHA